jgi:nitroreductase
MEFFDAVKTRRSVRKFTSAVVPGEIIEKALNAALAAPNSSNMQTWGFYWVNSANKKMRLIEACLNQTPAKTATEFVVVTAEPKNWKRVQGVMLGKLKEQNAPLHFQKYYQKLIPFLYGLQFLAPLKWLLFNGLGLFKPTPRIPWHYKHREEVAIKSAALGAENFMLAIAAQGYGTCPMEGFDEPRVKRLLGLGFLDRVVMVIAVGEVDSENGIWGDQIRCDRSWFVHKL